MSVSERRLDFPETERSVGKQNLGVTSSGDTPQIPHIYYCVPEEQTSTSQISPWGKFITKDLRNLFRVKKVCES
jgi:hypothetical protein